MLIAGLVARLFQKALADSGDFLVYWRAARAWLSGSGSPYGLLDPSAVGFTFKYPPWILPLFVPFGLLPFSVAKWMWAILELLCLIYSMKRLAESGARIAVIFFVALCFWWIWQDHFWSGQLTIVMLAATLWITPSEHEWPLADALTAWLLSSKFYTLVTLLGKWRSFLRAKTLVLLTLLVLAPTTLVWGLMWTRDPAHAFSLADLFREFAHSASSGGIEMGVNTIRSGINHSFTAAILRVFGISSEKQVYDSVVPIVLAGVLGAFWSRISRGMDRVQAWSGWIALGAVIHPLAWDHSFVMAYPICVLALESALRSKRRLWIGVAIAGVACIGLIVPYIFGSEFVKPFDFVSTKSWGVVLCALTLRVTSPSQV